MFLCRWVDGGPGIIYKRLIDVATFQKAERTENEIELDGGGQNFGNTPER